MYIKIDRMKNVTDPYSGNVADHNSFALKQFQIVAIIVASAQLCQFLLR